MNMQLDSDLLRTFLAIAETGSFTAAAGSVGRTQSAISMQVKRLEDISGGELFSRNARGVTLTEAGRSLLSGAREVIELMDKTESLLRTPPLTGKLRMGVYEDYSLQGFPDALRRFAAINPDVQVSVYAGSSDYLYSQVVGGKLDMAIFARESDSSAGEEIAQEPIVWVSSKDHDVHLHDPLPIALCEDGCWWNSEITKILEREKRSFHVTYMSQSSAGMLATVRAGVAVSLISRSLVTEDCRILTTEDGFPDVEPSTIALAVNPKRKTPATEAMAGAIRAQFDERV